jgi:PAS domain S-box-containing protein
MQIEIQDELIKKTDKISGLLNISRDELLNSALCYFQKKIEYSYQDNPGLFPCISPYREPANDNDSLGSIYNNDYSDNDIRSDLPNTFPDNNFDLSLTGLVNYKLTDYEKPDSEINRQVSFEKAATNLSMKILNCSYYEPDRCICEFLRFITEFFHFDDAYIISIDKNSLLWKRSNIWILKDSTLEIPGQITFENESLKWNKKYLEENKITFFSASIHRSPLFSSDENRILKNENAITILNIPIETPTKGSKYCIRLLSYTLVLNFNKEEINRLKISGGIIGNLIERKQHEQGLMEYKSKYDDLFNRSVTGYLLTNTENIIIKANISVLNILGYRDEEVLSHNISDIFYDNEFDFDYNKLKFIEMGYSLAPIEKTLALKNGNSILVIIEKFPLGNSEEEITGIFFTISDISSIRQNELELKISNERLEVSLNELKEIQKTMLQQERMKTLGQIASGIAHDINNSLSPIIGYSDLILMTDNIDPQIRKRVSFIKIASKDIMETVQEMREFYKPIEQDEELTEVNLNLIATSTLSLTKYKWKNVSESTGKVIEVKCNFQPDLPNIPGNASEIREALTNLIINAVDAMPQGGTLSLKSFALNKNIILEISDTGIGMDENTRHHCLNYFFTTKGEKGSGLGLPMVNNIILKHKGSLEIISNPGEGTVIKLFFPIPQIKIDKEIAANPKSMPILRILCIDDNKEVGEILHTLLKRKKHSVDLANNGRQGLSLFNKSIQNLKRYDLVITDLGMPFMDGATLAKEIKSISPATPIILMTGWSADLTDMDIENIDFLLKKPITIDELDKSIISIAEKYHF